MKKIIFALSVALMASVAVQAQKWKKIEGNGNIVKQSRETDSFTGIGLAGSMEVKVSAGAIGVQVEADDNLQEYITTKVKNGSLQIGAKEGYNIKSKKKIVIYVSLQTLNSVQIAGSGSVTGTDGLKSDDKLEVAIAGSGHCGLLVKSQKTKASISGSGTISLSGSTGQLSVAISGSGNYKGYELKTASANVAISGSGDAETNITENLTASISGSGNVYYKGAGNVSVRTSGSGHLRKVD